MVENAFVWYDLNSSLQPYENDSETVYLQISFLSLFRERSALRKVLQYALVYVELCICDLFV